MNVNSYTEEIFDLGTDSFNSAKSVIGSQTLHTTVTSFFRSLHTKGKKFSLHTSHFIPMHSISEHFIQISERSTRSKTPSGPLLCLHWINMIE